MPTRDMTPSEKDDPPRRPTKKQAKDLKRLAAGIIRAQGNRFIKELLRSNQIRIGANKNEFEANLNEAIESGKLDFDAVDKWLKRVEGWGNQHVYLYDVSGLLKELNKISIYRRVKRAGLESVWDGDTTLAYPDKPKLTSISFTNSVLRLVWQESSPAWTPVPEKNKIVEEDLDIYEYRAWRKVEHRAITRFEARVDDELAGLFVATPIGRREHKEAVAEVKGVISKLLDIEAFENGQIDISVVSKRLDQRNVPGGDNPDPEVKTQKSRLEAGGAYVEFAANSSEKAYWEEEAIRDVRKSVKEEQLEPLHGSGGVFIFRVKSDGEDEGQAGGSRKAKAGTEPDDKDNTRPVRVLLFGNDKRIRLWHRMDRSEVWQVLVKLRDALKSKDSK